MEIAMKTGKKIILDLDTGIDDSIALACATLHPDVQLLGVTGTYGNVTTEQGVRNALDVLSLMGCNDVPVYAGCTHALEQVSFQPEAVSTRIHGKNGLGEVILPPSMREAESEHAVDFLIRSMVTYGDTLTLVTTGPCTNLAAVLLAEPALRFWKGKVVIMGGALTFRGNVTHFAEANIINDPEAAKLVLESGLDVTMVGLDVTTDGEQAVQHSQSILLICLPTTLPIHWEAKKPSYTTHQLYSVPCILNILPCFLSS
jgi:purine nucleosidase